MNATDALPDLQASTFDLAALEELLSDIEQLGDIHEIIPKAAAQDYVDDSSPLSFADAKALLKERKARAVQFRYSYKGVDWWDTIMIQPDGTYRLIRIEHNFDHLRNPNSSSA